MLRYEICSKEKILLCSSHSKHRSLQHCCYSTQVLFSLFKQLLHISLHYRNMLKINTDMENRNFLSGPYSNRCLQGGNLTSPSSFTGVKPPSNAPEPMSCLGGDQGREPPLPCQQWEARKGEEPLPALSPLPPPSSPGCLYSPHHAPLSLRPRHRPLRARQGPGPPHNPRSFGSSGHPRPHGPPGQAGPGPGLRASPERLRAACDTCASPARPALRHIATAATTATAASCGEGGGRDGVREGRNTRWPRPRCDRAHSDWVCAYRGVVWAWSDG